MKKIALFLDEYKLYFYFSLIVAVNNLWFLDFLSTWFLTFAIILTMPIFGLDILLTFVLIAEDGIFKMVGFYFEPKLFSFYPVYLISAVALVVILHFVIKRIKKERYELISNLHRLKSEEASIESSLPETLNLISRAEKEKGGVGSLIQSREDSYKNILNVIKQSFHPYSIVLYFYSKIDNSFYIREFISESDDLRTVSIRSSEGVLHTVIKERRLINISGPENLKIKIPYYSGREDVKSFLALPLMSGKRLKGILCVDSLTQDRFTIKEEEIIKNLGKEIIKVIDSSETMVGLTRVKEELLNVCELGTRLNKSLSRDETIDALMDITKKFIDYDFSCFVSFDPEIERNKIVRLRSSTREVAYEGRDFSCQDKLGLVSWVIKNNLPLEYCQIQGKNKEIILFNKSFKVPFRYNSVLIIPVKSANRVQGAFILASNRGSICREEDKNILEGVCSQVGISLENARLYETLKHMATTDGLTGLNNHRVFQESLSAEIERYERHPDKFSLLLIDIDHFKKINDTYGHPVGDFVLKEISKILQSMIRKVDLAARYGGEEFAIILVGTDELGSIKMGERIREKVMGTKFNKDNLSLEVTISVGAATFPANAGLKKNLIDNTDKALYLAKKSGRNQTIHYSAIQRQMEQYKNLEREQNLNDSITN